jgi:fructose-1,6-bisphosphatase-3
MFTCVYDDSDARASFDDAELFTLRTLADQVPSVDHAVARIAMLGGELTLPKGTVHVFSDVHGEHVKLRHIINNASGRLAPLIDEVLHDLPAADRRRLRKLIYYPSETLALTGDNGPEAIRTAVRHQLRLLRALAGSYPVHRVVSTFPAAYRDVLLELMVGPLLGRDDHWVDTVLNGVLEEDRGPDFLRLLSRTLRNLTVEEILVAGDLGDRGPRIDKVISYLMRQPEVSILWGNHDVLWMGACLGQEALIATVIRVSLRYGRLAQLEEGYGIPLLPLQTLARSVYGDDPCPRFKPKVCALEDQDQVRRMQKAIAVIQFKLEGGLLNRHPEWNMDDRRLMHRIDKAAGTVRMGDDDEPLADTHLPTLDPDNPYQLTAEEQACMDQLTASFLHSPVLWEQMTYLFKRGAMYAARDETLLFHACIPIDDDDARLEMTVDGRRAGGKDLFDAFSSVLHRAWRDRDTHSVDHLWYLWAGPVSPLFGKDKMATFESYFLEDKRHSTETKNPYFVRIHDAEFCRGIFKEFGINPERTILVNGHVPVKVEAGEDPVKQGGNAVTIDGAFAEAYGDRGYTMVLEAERTYLAEHHSFTSVEDAIVNDTDIVPTTRDLCTYDPPRTVADTQRGTRIRRELEALHRLVLAYRENLLQEGAPALT